MINKKKNWLNELRDMNNDIRPKKFKKNVLEKLSSARHESVEELMALMTVGLIKS